MPDRPDMPDIWAEARRLREKYWGRQVFLRGIVEFSNHCRQNCLYCGLRRDNTSLPRYRMDSDAIYRRAQIIKNLGLGTIVLQSGEDLAYANQDLAQLITNIKTRLGLAVTLSLGERDDSTYRLWREAGADRYLLKIETANEQAYAQLRPGRQLHQRLRSLRVLADMGYETGSGLILGLPGETEEIREQGYKILAALKLDMLSISPFVPHPDTPLHDLPAYDVPGTLQAMATARVFAPTAHIPVTSALGLHGDDVRLLALEVGDVLMPSLTPEEVREAYAIYPGKNMQTSGSEERAKAMCDMLLKAGFSLPSGPGGAWRLTRKQPAKGARHESGISR